MQLPVGSLIPNMIFVSCGLFKVTAMLCCLCNVGNKFPENENALA